MIYVLMLVFSYLFFILVEIGDFYQYFATSHHLFIDFNHMKQIMMFELSKFIKYRILLPEFPRSYH